MEHLSTYVGRYKTQIIEELKQNPNATKTVAQVLADLEEIKTAPSQQSADQHKREFAIKLVSKGIKPEDKAEFSELMKGVQQFMNEQFALDRNYKPEIDLLVTRVAEVFPYMHQILTHYGYITK